MSTVCVCATVKIKFDNTTTCKYSIAMLRVFALPPIQRFWIRPWALCILTLFWLLGPSAIISSYKHFKIRLMDGLFLTGHMNAVSCKYM